MRGRGQSRAAFDDSSDVYYNDGVFTDGSCRVGAGPLPLRASLPSGPSRAAGAAIALEDVSLSLGGPGLETEILRGTSLRVANGEFACLLGPSGSGKSTILNLLAGLARPTAGRVLRGGTPVEGPGPDRALVFQDAALFPWLTLQDNVEFPLKVQKMSARDRADRSEELLRLVHLWSFAARYPHQLSGGMRQRGAIARALATDPAVLLMDEPFAALDAQTRDILQAEVERIWIATGKTIVFVTHNVREAVRLGDHIVLMGTRPGRVLHQERITLDRPRAASDRRVNELADSLAARIASEVEKVAREEADDAWVAPVVRGPRGLRRLVGRGG